MARSEIKNETKSLMATEPKSIIITPLHNLMVRNTVYKPQWLRASYRYDWAEIENYFYKSLGEVYLPMHYFCNIIGDDYATLIGCPLSNQSYFLHALARVDAIQTIHANGILVAIQEDLREEPVDRRMMAFLSNYCLSPLMRLFGIGQERVFYIDEILVPEYPVAINKINDKRRLFNIEHSKYFDKNQLLFQLRNYLKR